MIWNLTGFDEDECLKMIEDLSWFDDKVPEDDIDVEEELEKLGNHYLMCGDRICESDVRKGIR